MCYYRTDDGKCRKYSDDRFVSYCVDGPCPDDTPTNADRIRGMSDDSAVDFIVLNPKFEFDVCACCDFGNTQNDDRGVCLAKHGYCSAEARAKAIKIWLRKPAEEADHA